MVVPWVRPAPHGVWSQTEAVLEAVKDSDQASLARAERDTGTKLHVPGREWHREHPELEALGPRVEALVEVRDEPASSCLVSEPSCANPNVLP